MKNLLVLSMTVLLFSGCFFEDTSDKKAVLTRDAPGRENIDRDSTKLSSAEIEARSKKDIAEITMRKELASEKLQKELELQKIQHATDKKKLSIDKALELERIRQKTVILEQENRLELQKYIVLLSALVMLLIAGAVYFFVKNRREDKLRAYNDNLEKYFRIKENEMRYKIADKVIDTVSKGGLSKEQEAQLLDTLHGKFESSDEDTLQIEDARLIDKSYKNEKE